MTGILTALVHVILLEITQAFLVVTSAINLIILHSNFSKIPDNASVDYNPSHPNVPQSRSNRSAVTIHLSPSDISASRSSQAPQISKFSFAYFSSCSCLYCPATFRLSWLLSLGSNHTRLLQSIQFYYFRLLNLGLSCIDSDVEIRGISGKNSQISFQTHSSLKSSWTCTLF